MRILHLDGGKEMRGGQWQVVRLIEGLTAAGVESTLLAGPDSPLFAWASGAGRRVEPFGLRRALSLAREHDLLHAHDGHGHTLGAIVAPRKLLVSRRVAFAPRSAIKYRRAKRYLAVSEYVKGALERGEVPAEKISVVYDGVPLLPLSHGNAVMAPASDDPKKGSALAREAARLAGISLQLSADLPRHLSEASIFLYLTHSEGLGSGALLAMSAGVPVIASNVGGLPEIIRHGENGLLVENDPAVISDSLQRLLSDQAMARRLGAAGRKTIEEKFTVDHMVRRTMEIYQQALS